ncbi:MAG: IS5/IS1182 family transposase, partial [Cyanobacteria bacterium QS_6_48_18]
LTVIGADGTYRGQDFLQWVFDAYRWILEVV